MFTALLSALGLQPKNLQEARGTLDSAKGTLEQVGALFTAAGLNLEQMLEAGPESLKAHVASFAAKDIELAAALEKINALEASAADSNDLIATLEESAQTAQGLFEIVGFVSPEISEGADEGEAFKSAFASHVKQAAALELSKHGHPPVAIVPDAPVIVQNPVAALPPLARVQAAFRSGNK